MGSHRSNSFAEYAKQHGPGSKISGVPKNLQLGSFSLPTPLPSSYSIQPIPTTSFSLATPTFPRYNDAVLPPSRPHFQMVSTSLPRPTWQPPISLNELSANDLGSINSIANNRSENYAHQKGAYPVDACSRTSALAERMTSVSFDGAKDFASGVGAHVFEGCMFPADSHANRKVTGALYQQLRNDDVSPPVAFRCATATSAFSELLPTGFGSSSLFDYHPLSETEKGRIELRTRRLEMVQGFCVQSFSDATLDPLYKVPTGGLQAPTSGYQLASYTTRTTSSTNRNDKSMLQISIIERGDHLSPDYRYKSKENRESIYPKLKQYTIAIYRGTIDGTRDFIHSVMHPIDTIAKPIGHFVYDGAVLMMGKSSVSLLQLEQGINPAVVLNNKHAPAYFTDPVISKDSDAYRHAKTRMLERRDNLAAFSEHFGQATGPERVRIATSIAVGGVFLPGATISIAGKGIHFFRNASISTTMISSAENAAISAAHSTTSMAGAASAASGISTLSDAGKGLGLFAMKRKGGRVNPDVLHNQPLFTLEKWDETKRVNIVRHFSPEDILSGHRDSHSALFVITQQQEGYVIAAAPSLYREGNHIIRPTHADLAGSHPVLVTGSIEIGHDLSYSSKGGVKWGKRHISEVLFETPVTFSADIQPLLGSLVEKIFKQKQFPIANATFVATEYSHPYLNAPVVIPRSKGPNLFTHPEWEQLPVYKTKIVNVTEKMVNRMVGDHTLLYVLRNDGTFILTTQKVVQHKIATYYSFGSLAEQQPVYAAGHVLVRDGNIAIIDNFSPLATTGPKLKEMVLEGLATKGFDPRSIADKFVQHTFEPHHLSDQIILGGAVGLTVAPSAIGIFRPENKLHLHPPHFKPDKKEDVSQSAHSQRNHI